MTINAKNIKKGTTLTIGTGNDSFKMVASNIKANIVTGLHADGIGEVSVPVSEVTRIGRSIDPKSWKNMIDSRMATNVEVKAPRKKPGKKPAPGQLSKADRAVELARQNPTMSRKDFIALLQAELNMSIHGASTYATNARKALARS